MTQPLILLVNDDGIDSPGLAASAAALAPLGDLLIVAPRTQQSGMGRSMPTFNDGRIFEAMVRANGQQWPGYAIHASPAQAVQHAVLELAERRIALAVSGINYGENVGTGITVSGTVGAALEASAYGIPALAVSLQVDPALHLTHNTSVDFSTAGHFTHLFARRWLDIPRVHDVDVLKIDVPADATPDTTWRVTRLERRAYYRPVAPQRRRLQDEGKIGYEFNEGETMTPNSDAATVLDGLVSVTPLSLDATSHIAPDELRASLDRQTETESSR
jgi:5'-nucleotidase